MRHIEVTALESVHAIAVIGELAAPARLRSGLDAQQTSDFTGSYAICHCSLKNLQAFAAICCCGQFPSSTPQLAWIFFEAISNAAAVVRVLPLWRSV